MTKEQLLKLLSEYKPGLWQKIIGKPDEFDTISNFINSLSPGKLLPAKLLELIRLINGSESKIKDIEKLRIITLINAEIAKELAVQAVHRATYRTSAELIKRRLGEGLDQSELDQFILLLHNSYYYDQSHHLILMLQEITGVDLKKIANIIDPILALSLLSFVIYSALKGSPAFSAQFIQLLSRSLFQKLNSYHEFSSYISDDIEPFLEYLPSLQWWLGLVLQLGLGIYSGVGGHFVSAYIGGTLFQSFFHKLTENVSAPSWLQHYTRQYPETFSCITKCCSDITFGLGAYLGGKVYSNINYFNRSQQNESRSEKDNNQERKDNSRQSDDDQRKNNAKDKNKSSERKTHDHKTSDEQSSKNNFSGKQSFQWQDTTDQLNCKKIAPVYLSDSERSLLKQQQFCDANKSECLQIVYKIARLDTNKAHANKEIKSAFRALSFFWHPDKYPKECPNGSALSEQQMSYINNAREAWQRLKGA